MSFSSDNSPDSRAYGALFFGASFTLKLLSNLAIM